MKFELQHAATYKPSKDLIMANRNIAIVFTFCYLIITKTIRETKFKIGKSCLGVIPVKFRSAAQSLGKRGAEYRSTATILKKYEICFHVWNMRVGVNFF